MVHFPNLISNSLLVNSTIDLLESLGGKAPATIVVDRVMNIRKPDPALAILLASDLANKDPRIRILENDVELENTDHGSLKLTESSFVVFDLETTGAKAPPCRITEIGAFRVVKGAIVEDFHSLIDPKVPIPAFITSLTGISDEMVASAPVFEAVIPELLDFIGDSILVAHNSSFDMGFLNYEIGKVYENYRIWNPAMCTVQLSRKILPNIENHKLNTVAEHYSIELRNHHRASDDARATALIFINLLEELVTLGIDDLGSAYKFCARRNHEKKKAAA